MAERTATALVGHVDVLSCPSLLVCFTPYTVLPVIVLKASSE